MIHEELIPYPILDWNFAQKRNLINHQGVGDIAFSRASADTEFDHNLNLKELVDDDAAFANDPLTRVSYGLQVPRSTVNEARNNRATGATVGVIGSGGVLPTNWDVNASGSGLSREVVGTGTEDGIPYCDLRFFGTALAGNTFMAQMSNTDVVAAPSEVWTYGCFVRLVGGDMTNVSQIFTQVQDRDVSGGYLANSTTNFTPTSAALKTQRYSHTRTLSHASTARVYGSLAFSTIVGAVDFTIRLAGAQLEEAPFATPLVLTDPGGSSARAVTLPTIDLTSLPGWVDGGPLTALIEWTKDDVATTISNLFSFSDGTLDIRIHLAISAAGLLAHRVESGAAQSVFGDTSAVSVGRHRAVVACKTNDYVAYLDGVESHIDNTVVVPSGLTTLGVGISPTSGAPLDGAFPRLTVWNEHLGGLAQQISALAA
jgi:hypothetical protein